MADEKVVDGSDTPAKETPTISPAERFARFLSVKAEAGGADEPEAGVGLPKKPSPTTQPPASAEEAKPEAGADDETPAAEDKQVTEAPRYKVKVDGEETEVALDELLRGYSYNAHNTRTAQKIAAERKAFEAEQKQTRELTEQYRAVLPKLEDIAKKAVDAYAGVDWDRLRAEDPAAFAEHRAAYQLEQDKLRGVQEEKQSEEKKVELERAEEFKGYIAHETDALYQKVPEWKDEAKRNDELGKISEFAVKQLGFTPEDLANTFDHRLINALRMAWQGSRVLANADKAKDKVAEARKTAKPGSRKEETSKPELERLVTLRERVRKSGRDTDAADALNALFAVKG